MTAMSQKSGVIPPSLPVSGVDPAGALVNVVDVINFPIKVSGFLPTLR